MPNKYYTNKKANDENLYFWFTETIYCDLNDIKYLQDLKEGYLLFIKFGKSINNSTDYEEEQYREEHYNQLRQVTEFFYKIRVYLPIMRNIITKKWNKFVVTIYKKIQELYKNLDKDNFDNLLCPKTDEEKRIVKILLEELLNTENVLIPLLSKKYTAKHLVKCVTEEPYKVMKSKNHILFVYSDEEFDCKLEEPIKIMKSNNHILFMYNE